MTPIFSIVLKARIFFRSRAIIASSMPSTAVIAADGEHHHAPPDGRRPEQIEGDADEGIDRDLGHHAAHQRRDMARGGGMGERQPDVQRNEAGFRSRADQRENEDEAGEPGRRRSRAHRGETVIARGPREQAEGKQQHHRAEARHQQIDEAGVPVFLLVMMRDDKRPGGERHELPGEKKAVGIGREKNEVHAGEKGRKEGQDAAGHLFMRAIAERIKTREHRAEIDDDRERSSPERRAENARRARAGQRAA